MPLMPLSFRPPRELLKIAETLLIATAGGVAFTLIGFPAGLIAGSMLAVAVAALIGRPMQVPLPLARVCFVLVGILLGAVVTPEMLEGIAAWPASIAIGDHARLDGPSDGECWIIPAGAPSNVRRMSDINCVEHICIVGQGDVAVCAAGRRQERLTGGRVQFE